MPILEARFCQCGLAMHMSRKHPEVGMCANCDGLQPQEKAYNMNDLDEDGEPRPFARVLTPFDRKYAATMNLAEHEWYGEEAMHDEKTTAEVAALRLMFGVEPVDKGTPEPDHRND